jgi:hypothetical protein
LLRRRPERSGRQVRRARARSRLSQTNSVSQAMNVVKRAALRVPAMPTTRSRTKSER